MGGRCPALALDLRTLSVVISITNLLCVVPFGWCYGGDGNQGPVFIQEPPHRADFSNTTGISVLCSAHGSPTPIIHWVFADESPVEDIPGLRHILANGTLVFVPFPAEEYRPDVHSAAYRCVATNGVGAIVSRRVHVRAVVKQFYEVQVYDEFVILGNTAVLKCHIPSFVREFVTVTSWARGPGEHIVTDIAKAVDWTVGELDLIPGGRYTVFPSGELHIRRVTHDDGVLAYRCETRHTLTGEQRLSAISGRVIVTDPQSSVPPRVTDSRSTLQARQKEPVEMPCAAQGFPLPSYTWYVSREDELTVPVKLGSRIRQVSGSLFFEHATVEDSARYTCLVNNSVGAERAGSTLTVTAPLSAYISPQVQTVDVGKTAFLNCTTEGHPQLSVTWRKDGRRVVNSSRIRILEGQVLRLDFVERDDRGMYQCVVSNAEETAQGTAQLKLGDAAPIFVSKFLSETLPAGPSWSARCEASGSPPPAITWLLDGTPLVSNKRVAVSNRAAIDSVLSYVNISALHLEDGGTYECVATNSVGRIRHSAILGIYGDPYIKPMPDRNVVAGKSATFQCLVSGYPISDVHWERDGKTLPENHRQHMHKNGTLTLQGIQKIADEGGYVCVASNPGGKTARRKLNVQVLEAPEIDQFHAKPRLQRGMRMHLTCVVSKGDFPIVIKWLKDGAAIPPGMGISERTLDEYSSTLTFSGLVVAHSGNYTCQASNAAATTTHTTAVVVNVPPSWRVEPEEQEVVVGGSAMLHCAADGLPPPTISWKKETAAMSGIYKELEYSSPNCIMLANGSLWIEEARAEEKGNYLCQAANGVGAELSKVTFLTVHVPARFASRSENMSVARGQVATLNCLAEGDKPLTIRWMREGVRFDAKHYPRASISEKSVDSGFLSSLVFRNTHREDSAKFACEANNRYGTADFVWHLMVQEPPEAPLNFRMISYSSRAVNLTWDPPFDGNSGIVSYITQFKNASGMSGASTPVAVANAPTSWGAALQMKVPGDQLTATINGLHPAHNYQFRVLAENVVGMSNSSDVIVLSTSEEIPGGAPGNLKVTVKNSDTLLVSWKPPDKYLHHGEIIGYYIGYRVSNSTETFHYKTLEVIPGMALENSLTNLQKFTEYSVLVQAYNRAGAGPRTPEVTATTDEDVPGAPPTDVQCNTQSSQKIHVYWTPPLASDINGILMGYRIVYRALADWNEMSAPMEQTTRAYKIDLFDLERYRNYSIEVKAFTRKGDGVSSRPIFCRTFEDVPGPPAEIKALIMDSETVLLSWRPPAQRNGRITKYKVYLRALEGISLPKDEFDIPAEQTDYSITHLSVHSRFEFWTTAFTVVGEGAPSSRVTKSPKFDVPARIISFGDEIVSAWKEELRLACKVVGTTERLWRFNGKVIYEDGRIQVFKDGSLVISTVQSNDAGNYSCFCENRHGKDEIIYHVTVQASRNKGIPIAPAIFQVSSSTVSSISFVWKHGVNNGNIVQGYYLHYKREFGEWEKIKLPADSTNYTSSGLQCGAKYQFYVRAFNQLGLGNPSPTIHTRTQGLAPVSPKGIDLIRVNSTSISLDLATWKDGGCPITSLVVEYRQKLSLDWVLVSNNIKFEPISFAVLDLSPETGYTLRMTAHNSAGSTVVNYDFITLTHSGATIAPELVIHSGFGKGYFYQDLGIIIPIIAGIAILIILLGGIVLYLKRKKELPSGNKYGEKAVSKENKEMQSETALMAELERKGYSSGQSHEGSSFSVEASSGREASSFLATPMRVSLGRREDISPYATFRLPVAGSHCGLDNDSSSQDDISSSHQRHRRHHQRQHQHQHHQAQQLQHNDKLQLPASYGSCADSIYTKIRKKQSSQFHERVDLMPLNGLYQANRY